MGAAADCELIGAGFLAQPVNSFTTLAFVIAGIWTLRRTPARWVGIALIATGVGSLVFHGPMPAWGEWAHDVTLAWLIVVIGGLNTRWEAWSRTPSLFVIAVSVALFPVLGDPIAVAATVIVLSSILLRRPTPIQLAPLVLAGVVAVLGRLGATGWPLCDPESVWQMHGLWHIGAAVAVAWWTAEATAEASFARV